MVLHCCIGQFVCHLCGIAQSRTDDTFSSFRAFPLSVAFESSFRDPTGRRVYVKTGLTRSAKRASEDGPHHQNIPVRVYVKTGLTCSAKRAREDWPYHSRTVRILLQRLVFRTTPSTRIQEPVKLEPLLGSYLSPSGSAVHDDPQLSILTQFCACCPLGRIGSVPDTVSSPEILIRLHAHHPLSDTSHSESLFFFLKKKRQWTRVRTKRERSTCER